MTKAKQKICVVAPTWQRPLIATLFCQQLVRWRDYVASTDLPLEIIAVVVGSEEEKSESLVRHAFGQNAPFLNYLEFTNLPLGRKFNAGIKYAEAIGADWVMIMGDDAFCLPSVFHDYALAIEEGFLYVGCRDLYSWDYKADIAHYWPGYIGKREGEPIGSGRLVHSSLLDEMGWMPYDESLSKNLDYSMTQYLGKMARLKLLNAGLDHKMTTIKGDNNLTDMHRFPDTTPCNTSMFYELLH